MIVKMSFVIDPMTIFLDLDNNSLNALVRDILCHDYPSYQARVECLYNVYQDSLSKHLCAIFPELSSTNYDRAVFSNKHQCELFDRNARKDDNDKDMVTTTRTRDVRTNVTLTVTQKNLTTTLMTLYYHVN